MATMTRERTNHRSPAVLDEELCWQAVLARDDRFDGAFVLGVRSTGIYCRPTCPARRPRREHVVFFPTPAAAEEAGFRSCRRCLPEKGAGYDAQLELVQQICQHVEANLEASLTLTALGRQASMSPQHLQRTFKRIMGITPSQYIRARRLATFKEQVREGQSVTSALYEAGYGSSSRLYENGAGELGMTPATYRRGGRGMRISYTIADCPLGRLLVAATERGICAVSFGDTDSTLEAALHGEYPAAEVEREEAQLAPWVAAILSHLDGQQPHLDLPLETQATAFQRRVWEELRAIPYGATRSYSEIARAVGRPKAARAVGRACATNPASIVIPCHRAVAQDGSLAGYRWGIERKRALLEREQEATRPRLYWGVTTAASRRNGWLRLDDAALRKQCREERYRASGPGGQRRNKVETAIRFHHGPSGLAAHAEESRSLQENRVRALRRLRERIALELRAPFDLRAAEPPPELVAQRGPKGSLAVNARNPAYPLVVATVLDALVAADGSYAKAARALGLTTSQLLRFLQSDRALWRTTEQRKRAQGKRSRPSAVRGACG